MTLKKAVPALRLILLFGLWISLCACGESIPEISLKSTAPPPDSVDSDLPPGAIMNAKGCISYAPAVETHMSFDLPLRELYYSATANVGVISLERECDTALTQFVLSFPSGATANSTVLKNLMLSWDPNLDHEKWAILRPAKGPSGKPEVDPHLRVQLSVTCAQPFQATHRDTRLSQDILSIALSPQILRTTGIAQLDDECTLNSLTLIGTPNLTICGVSDKTCSN